MKIKVIGAGIFGCCISTELSDSGHEVVLIEQDNDIMQRASRLNHNKIHYGYHYPRSLKTARQSIQGHKKFLDYFNDAIVSEFSNYYMISKKDSKVTKEEYIKFCDELGIEYEFETPNSRLVDLNKIDLSIKVKERIFDYETLYTLVKDRLENVDLRLNESFDGNTEGFDFIINTSYSNLNLISEKLGIDKLDLKFQDVVIPIFKMNYERIGLTIMDGQFCSFVPKGKSKNQFLLYHPKYSIVSESKENLFSSVDVNKSIKQIYEESKKFFPFLDDVQNIDYWRTIRALPINSDDSRVSEIFTNHKNSKYINVLSGKITTCLDVSEKIKLMIEKMS